MADSLDQRNSLLQQLRAQTLLEAGPAGKGVWSEQQWYECFVQLFCQPSTAADHDDLLFFVLNSLGAASQGAPLLLRRKTQELAADVVRGGTLYSLIAWKDTVLLNHVIQGVYELTVVACSQEMLPLVAEGRAKEATEVVSVTKRVFASPSYTSVNLETSKATTAPQISYPDVCFAVDAFEDAFENMVLSQPDDCYCVLLHAVLPQAGTSKGLRMMDEDAHLQGQQQAQSGSPSRQEGQVSLVLFSAYVLAGAIWNHLHQQKAQNPGSGLGWLGRMFNPKAGGGSERVQRDRIWMNGPNGVGKAEVAVARMGCEPQHQGEPAHMQEGPRSAAGTQPVGRHLHQAPPKGSMMLQCGLMSLSLPVASLANQLLGAA